MTFNVERIERNALIHALRKERRKWVLIGDTLASSVEDQVLESKRRGQLLRFPTLLNRPLDAPFRRVELNS
jgi:hypothetical protein